MNGEPGGWVTASSWTSVCRDGVYACERRHLPLWIWEELWEMELDGDVEAHDQKLRARRGRLTRRIEPWSAGGAKAFARACAGRAALHASEPLRAAGQPGAAAVLEAATTSSACGSSQPSSGTSSGERAHSDGDGE